MRIIAARLSGRRADATHPGCLLLHRHGCQGSNFQDEAGKSLTNTYLLRDEVSS
jgi:hypothetical protein